MNDNILSCLNFSFSGSIVYFLSMKLKKSPLIFSLTLLLLAFIGNFKIFVFCPAILMLFISLEENVKDYLNKSLFSMLGNITYSTYLLHAPYSIILILYFKDNMEIYLNPIFFFLFILFL